TFVASEVIPQHTTLPLPFGSQIPKKSDHPRVVEYENEMILTAKRKAQAAKDRAVGKRAATEGAPNERRRRKQAEPVTEGDGMILESVTRAKEDTYQPLDNVEDTTEVNSSLSEHSLCFQHFNPSDEDKHNVKSHGVSSSSGGLHRRAFLGRNPGGDGIDTPAVRSQQSRLSDYQALQRSWFELGRKSLAHIDILQRYEALNEDYEKLFESHRFCRDVFDRKELGLIKKLVVVEKARDDLLDKDQEREERIKQLEADIASKTSSLTKSEGVVNTLKGDLECLTVDLGQAEIGVKASCSKEEAEAFLATAVDYDPACIDTFMSEFDSLFNKSYRYMEKLVESFWLPLGDLQNICPGLP
nr:hypothetical protein [Tanacetum cinerariifolium]